MGFRLISAADVVRLHDRVLNDGELGGLAADKSLEGALARVETRVAYGLVEHAHDLAAGYAMALARGHVFNDGNKRTAFTVMQVVLRLNGMVPDHDVIAAADRIIDLAQGRIDEVALAGWLRRPR